MDRLPFPTRDLYKQTRRKTYMGHIEFICRSPGELTDYFQAMARGIVNELQQYGHSWLIDHAFSNGTILALDLWIIQEVADAIESNRKLRIVLPDKGYDAKIPVNSEIDEMISHLYRREIPAVNNGENQVTPLAKTLSELNYQLEQAQATKKLLNDQIVQLSNRINQLRYEAERLQTETQNTQISIQAQLNNAKTQAEEIISNANTTARNIRMESLLHTAQNGRQETAAAGTDEAALKSTVEQETRRLENTLRSSLDSYRDELFKMIHDFRIGLYGCDYTPLCSAYQKLYMFATNILDKRIEELCSELGSKSLAEPVQSSLRKVQVQLLKRITSMESGLQKLGLTVFSPNKGEDYNDVFHAAENAEDDGYLEAKIDYCVCPGICTKEQVLCRAAVMLDVAERR